MTEPHRIMYVCTSCEENYPEGCGNLDRESLRVVENDWLCKDCFAGFWTAGGPRWNDLDPPPEYAPKEPQP